MAVAFAPATRPGDIAGGVLFGTTGSGDIGRRFVAATRAGDTGRVFVGATGSEDLVRARIGAARG